MQTFLPFPDIQQSAACLDRQRLGKQRVEASQILDALQGKSSGWVNHPATRMWRGHEEALSGYGFLICLEWMKRGYRDSLHRRFAPSAKLPPWFSCEAFHRSHQSNLLRKDFAYYTKFFPDVPNNLPYYWPEGS